MTFSIILRDPETQEIGAAIASRYPAVAGVCFYADHKHGLVSTQSMANPALGTAVLEHLPELGARAALEAGLASDPNRVIRQTLAMGWNGQPAVETGEKCIDWNGQYIDTHIVAAGNMLTGPDVLEAAVNAAKEPGTMAQRLLRALEAGEQAGGDKRGKQAAGFMILRPWTAHKFDLRVDDDPEPVSKLRNIYTRLEREGVFGEFDRTVPHEHNGRLIHPDLSSF